MINKFEKTDPEFTERLNHFAFDEVVNSDDMDDRTRMMAILAALIGCQGTDAFREMMPQALEAGVSPVEVREVVYQAEDYCGIGRVYPFIGIMNEVFTENGLKLPLEPQATTTMETRLEAGVQAQLFCLY